MNKIKKLGYTFFGNLSIALSKWLILIIIVRFTNPEEVGRYTLAIALTSPLLLFANMRLRTRYVVEDNVSFKSIQIIRTLTSIIMFFILLIIAQFVYNDLFYYIILLTLIRLVDLQSELYFAVYQKRSDFKSIGKNQILKSILVILTFLLFISLTESVTIALLSQAISQFIWMIFIERKATRFVEENLEKLKLKVLISIFILGLPLGLVQLINSYNIMIPRYVVDRVLTIDLVGVFASISYLLVIFDLFLNAISQNIILDIKEIVNKKNYKKLNNILINKLWTVFIVLTICIPLIVYIFSEDIINTIYGEYYANYSSVLVIISFSIGFNLLSWIYDATLMVFNVYKSQLIISVITFIFSIVFSIILISKWGIYGAAFTIVVISSVQAIIKLVLYKIVLKKRLLTH